MTKDLLAGVITSKTRIRLLEIFFSQPKEMFFVRQLTRLADDEINAVRRELARLERIGLLIKQERGYRLFYQLNLKHPLYDALQIIIARELGLGLKIVRARQQLGRIKFAFISKRLLNQQAYSADLVDVGFIGQMVVPEVDRLIKSYEVKLKREINYTILTLDELRLLYRKKDPFTLNLLIEPKVMIIGDEGGLVDAVKS